MQMYKRKSGITLVALIITIIILLILAGVSISYITGENSIIKYAGESKLAYELTSIKEIVQIGAIGYYEDENQSKYMNVEEADKLLDNIDAKYKNKIGMYRGQIVYLGDENSEIGKAAQRYGYDVINMTADEFKYYIELGKLEDSVLNIGYNVGRELLTQDFNESIQIGNNEYGYNWFIIGNYTEEEKAENKYNSQYEELGIKDTTHAPYLVNYSTGEVLSIEGMIMYQAEIRVHSFNSGSSKLQNAITYVDSFTQNNGDYYGNLYSTALYDGPVSVWKEPADYSDNNGKLQYDENGALILDEDNAIPVLEVNKKFMIDSEYSINITVEGSIYQTGLYEDEFPATIVALSDDYGKYLAWIGVYKGFLYVKAYDGQERKNTDKEMVEKGFASIDISKYQNKPINIQVIAKRSDETKVYINGELIVSFESGDQIWTYKYTTIGDLRVGRNLKFVGKVYNFGLYGVALNEEEVQENWEESRKYVEN